MSQLGSAPDRAVLLPHELADRWRVHRNTIIRWLTTGELYGFKVGRDWRIPVAVVLERENGRDYLVRSVAS